MDYQYIATDSKTNKRITAVGSADSVDHLVKILHSEGLLPIKVTEVKSQLFLTHLFKSKETIKGKELCIFTRQLGATLSSGLILTEALEVMSEDLENYFFQGIIFKIRNDIVAGTSFSSALMKYPKIFPKSYCQVVKSGEASGRLHITILDLAQYLEKIERVKEKVNAAMRYPMFILGFACLVMAAMVLLLIPKFKEIYEQADAKLPLMTQMLISISDFTLHYFLWIVIVAGLIVVGIIRFIQKPQMKETVDNLKFKIPLLGKEVIHKSVVSSFCRTLGFLISSGVEISASLDIVTEVVEHEGIRIVLKQVRKRVVTGGASLSIAIREHKIFPRMISKMILVGEKSGRLAEMLIRTADYYDQEVEHSVNGLLTLIEPVLIAVIGGIVGIVVVALYLPIFKLATVIK